MLRRVPPLRPAISPVSDRRRRAASVELAPHGRGAPGEAFIERIRRGERLVEVDVLLADGSDAIARLDAYDWDWLEMNAGDIVPVRPLSAPDVSG
jgi:hypothetical protein